MSWSTSSTAASADTKYTLGSTYSADNDLRSYVVWKVKEEPVLSALPTAAPTKSIAEVTVILETTTYTYDGTEKKPSISVKDQNVALIAGRDYSISYSDNKGVGTATVTINGKGNYTRTFVKCK